jgi:general secretion pathway protein I
MSFGDAKTALTLSLSKGVWGARPVSANTLRQAQGERGVGGGEAGFTLVELLVALALFSIAGLALLKLQGVTLASTGAIDRQLVASIVAQNIATDALTDAVPPAVGAASGIERSIGIDWAWRRVVTRTADPRMLRVDVAVVQDGRTLAGTTVVRLGAMR